MSRPRPPDAVPGYRLEKLLGKGGMGEVHLATQLSLGRKVAVKLLRDDLARDEAFVARFEKESAALASLRHPNIVTLLDKGKTDVTYFLVMELVEGPSLREVMRRPDWEPLLALRLFDQVARGVEYAHQQGVIHRDLKPENILLDEPSGGTPKVTDFGLAGFDEKAAIQLPLTQTHMAMGTASYMAPEQQIDARSVDHRADIYALGVLLYELLTGEVPRGTFQLPSVRKPGVDKRLDPVVTRCLKPDPKDRYPSVAELRKDLEVVLPTTSLLTPSRLTRGQKAKLWLRQAGRAAVRTAEGLVVVSALAVLLVAALRDGATKGHQSAGLELTVDSGVRRPSTVVGRLDRDAQRLTLGEGPDAVPLVARDRPVAVDRGTIVFAAPEELTARRTLLDAVPPGDGLAVS
ncbi:MAG: serine/threonine protein kinase, partial [Myxococcaceae bacterium]|nr:serine/threonine protein kinase [Myxococcaceae bacterium]